MGSETFDFVTHVRNPKSGVVEKTNHYRRRVSLIEGKGAMAVMERPLNSGIWYNEDNTLNEELSAKGLRDKASQEAAKKESDRVAALPAAEKLKLEIDAKQRELAKLQHAEKAKG